ncbi:hypothetical protein ACPCHT_32020 [Nucisporomicrobium flavum]|uniref:hypothetical protein n=1 Tax=Nucisporomicrobium flavum TaxID=2785915 RepID=UPI003C2F3F30
MTTSPHAHAPAAAPGSPRCPECGDPARPVGPTEWPLAGFAARPAASHADGTPLCPVVGPHGCQPADPVGVPARLTLWQAVRQTWLAHPDWALADHLAWLNGEGYDTDTADGDPAAVVGRWLAEHRRTTGLSLPASDPRVYVVAGGDMVAVLDDPAAAGTQHAVMQAAGLEVVAYTLAASQWEILRPLVRAVNPALVITDVRHTALDDPA